jgi:AbrB family looped-hinge helix DNA binding protein
MSTEDDIEGETTRVTRKGQVTIPKELREEYGLEEGDRVVWLRGEDGITVRKTKQGRSRHARR